MYEQSKAARRRAQDWHYPNLYFVGDGIDIGAGPDGLSKLREFYPKITSVRDWDLPDGDAQDLPGVEPATFDFVSASHVLEHLDSPIRALARWMAVLKPGGYMVITVPEWSMYERCHWPSRHGVGHRWAFTMVGPDHYRHILNVHGQLAMLGNSCPFMLERLLVLREHFNPDAHPATDQSLGPAECAIEFVLRKL
jgi:SAM-dependent methyltransferase